MVLLKYLRREEESQTETEGVGIFLLLLFGNCFNLFILFSILISSLLNLKSVNDQNRSMDKIPEEEDKQQVVHQMSRE